MSMSFILLLVSIGVLFLGYFILYIYSIIEHNKVVNDANEYLRIWTQKQCELNSIINSMPIQSTTKANSNGNLQSTRSSRRSI